MRAMAAAGLKLLCNGINGPANVSNGGHGMSNNEQRGAWLCAAWITAKPAYLFFIAS